MNKRKFADNLGYQKLWCIFIFGSIFGSIYEMSFVFLKRLIMEGIYFWEIRTGVIYGPFNIIYGFGAVIMAIFFINKGLKWYQILIRGSICGGLIEYIISLLQEVFTGTTSWNYNGYFLNINGRTTIVYMLFWGLICLFFVKIIYPILDKCLKKIPYKLGTLFLNILITFLIIDMFISFSAIIRQYLRRKNVEPITFYGEYLDKTFPDERLKKVYSNMEVVR